MTSIERTAYPRCKRLITAHELHPFFSPTRDELQWAADATDGAEHLPALLLMLKSYQRMGRFPALEEVPEQVVEFVRRQVELPEGTLPLYRAERTAKHHRGLVRKKVGVKYDQGEARRNAEPSIRKEAEAKNRPADLINIALEKLVEAGLELPGFSTFDKMASKIRTEVNASIRDGIHERMSPVQRAGLLRLLEERDSDGTTLFNRLKKPAKGPTWSHFKNLAKRLEWVDELGDTSVWMEPVATGKITDFAGEADAADASELRDYAPIKQIALIACLTHKARMRVRDDLATMFCKRVATKIKKAKEELEEIRLAEREIVEALIGNYRTVLKNIDADGPAQEAVQKAAAMTAEVRHALEGLDDEAPVDEVAQRLDGKVSPAVLAMAKSLVVQAGGLSAVTKAVEALGGFAGQYEQIEKTRSGRFVRKHFEVMVFTALAEELRTGDVAVVGSEKYADWSKQLLDWEVVKERLGSYLVEVGLCEEGETAAFDAVSLRRQLQDKLTAAAAAADAGYPDNEGLVIDPETGIPSLKPPLGGTAALGEAPGARGQGPDAGALAHGDRGPDCVLGGLVAALRTGVRQRAEAG
ncbi:DUF4158 domain-containing protein [Streptomyces sp. NPDC007369]|uniref:DUF4158 domain-containing protein n=1 Tax=Streptomyces sp. NPDC007369 TaxID=3154589 RepID=UPI0033C0ACDD